MNNDNTKISIEHQNMATAALDVLDTNFFKALCEPSRVEIVRKLITLGACDVSTIARDLTVDRSVVSRHLAVLERAGITAMRKDGRRVLYDLDGPYIVNKVTTILEAISPMSALCIPFGQLNTNTEGAA